MKIKDFSAKTYWDERYEKESEYEWLLNVEQIVDLFVKHVDKNNRILILGCGNSSLSYKLVKAGYLNVLSTDYSETVITKMKNIYSEVNHMKFEVLDIFNIQCDADSFDVVFEKGVIDAVVANESQWTYAKTHKTMFDKLMSNIHRILSKNGQFISITFHSEMFRLPLFIDFQTKTNLFNWNYEISHLENGFEFSIYFLTKSDDVNNSHIPLIDKYKLFCSNEKPIEYQTYTEEESEDFIFGIDL